MDKGFIHLYWGEGKGKTSAAAGLALRALGRGKRVVLLQFLKNGRSGELDPLRRLGAVVLSCKHCDRFLSQMSAEERETLTAEQNALLETALTQPCDVLILDEACAACRSDTVREELLKRALLRTASGCEVVLTGRNPPRWMREAADYSTEMVPHAHPYKKGITAREGIEF